MSIEFRSRTIVFVLSMIVWLALTDFADIEEIIAGLFVSLFVSLVAGHFLVTTEKQKHFFKRFFAAIFYFFKFLWEMIKANIHVAYIVAHPKLPIKPGIVKISTDLEKDSALTIMANSITLTPGTLTVDLDKDKKKLYIHWIDTKVTEQEKATKEIGGRFEKMLKEVFS